MAGNTVKMSDSTFHNWIKTGLALLYTKEGIQNDVVQEITTFHQQTYNDIINNNGLPAGTKCTSCTTKSIVICNPSNRLCKKIGSKCQTKHMPCPNSVCDDFRDRIVRAHRFSDPSFKNSDAQKWCVDFFEVMKCFMPPDGYDSKSTTEEVDFNGIISVVITFKNFQNKTAEKLHDKNNKFLKAREIGRVFRHTSSFDITDGDFNSYIDTLSDVLKDPKYFATLKETQEAVDKLEQLRSDSLTIVKKDAYKLLEEAIDSIKEHTDRFKECLREETASSLTSIETARIEAETSLSEKADDIVQIINEAYSKVIQEKEELQNRKAESDVSTAGRSDHEDHLDEDKSIILDNDIKIENDETAMQQEEKKTETKTPLKNLYKGYNAEHKTDSLESLALLHGHSDEVIIVDNESVLFQKRVNANIKHDYSRHRMVLMGQNERLKQQRKVLQRRLIETYEENYSKLQVSPLLEEEDAPLLDLYVSPMMKILEHHRVQSKEIEVLSYHDVFFKFNKECKNIYVTGDAGIGKTAFCQRMVLAWCVAHSQSKPHTALCSCFSKGNLQEKDSFFSNTDLVVLKSFDFLFYVSLRETNLCHIEDIIIQQVSCISNKTFLVNILDTKKCLIVIDGLDEWNHSLVQASCPPGQKVPQRQTYKKCTFLTTSRTSKLDIIRLRTSEIDHQVAIKGIGKNDHEKLVNAVVKHLNCMYNTRRDPKEIINFLGKNDLEDLSEIPIVVTQLICQWCEEVSSNTCKSVVYGKTVKMLFIRSKTLNSQQKEMLSVETTTFPDEWKKVPLLQHLAEFAYSTLFSDDVNTSGLVFGYEQLEQNLHGLTSEDMEMLCNVGIVSRNKVPATLSQRKIKLHFLHSSFHEFMSAVHIAMNYRESTGLPATVTNYFSKVSDFLELSNVLVFLASLCPKGLQTLNKQLLDILSKDERFVEYRQLHFHGFMSYKTNIRYNRYRECNSNLKALQTLWLTCSRESDRAGYDSTTYQLTDLYIDDETQKTDVEKLIQASTDTLLSVSTCCGINGPSSVDSLAKLHIKQEEAVSLLPRYTHLKCLVLSDCKLEEFSLNNLTQLRSLHLFTVMLQHDDLSSIYEQLAVKAVKTDLIQISLVRVKCNKHGFKGCSLGTKTEHRSERHTKLVTLDLRRVPFIIANLDTSQLESCNIETDVDIPTKLTSCLEGALKLQYLTFDLSNSDLDANRSLTFGEALLNVLPKLVDLKYLKLVNVDTGDNEFKLCPRIRALEQVKLWLVTLTLQSLRNFIDTLLRSNVMNVELLSCKINLKRGSCGKSEIQEIVGKVRADMRFMVTKCSKQNDQLLTLEFGSVKNEYSTNL
ncbi:uncharacterized protein LOC128554552 [Mercenaria mercenaria]|uniref:uncharacterized protein LOC128554552 n=1 Tax=Mercenaria mercenaria TaxID=6596 RepID=UPI00234EDBE3|nr:uncharacterized protein LOC128554552 [Mercenaria mercenaria]